MFAHPNTACNEQNLNSVVVKPAQGENLPLPARWGITYRIEGYAYNGGGHEVQRVEISLDDFETWLYFIRRFPDAPIRHGNKFWTWLHWHVDVEAAHLLRCKSISVRCWNIFKKTQSEHPNWNSMVCHDEYLLVYSKTTGGRRDANRVPEILFRHPYEPGNGDEGWMKPSTEQQVADAKQPGNTPEKQFT
ncbi:hypothetical protein ABVK25_009334 [Lepraria finkii]|uniref:Moybdenum cofactor oxidoreductase dimerisation domain-containing protein n=1 Tax=Lepraria finkii TaxID=1340010 RepID=A0ABR4AXH3_9LECA